MENLTTFAYWLGHGGPTDKEIQVRMEKKYWFRSALRIRIRVDPHDFGLLDPHSKCGFQMRMRIQIKLRKN
jgi:hypothetical protein